ncbi:WXG100 family type VII secretion target [Streptomyces flaveolus]|uniref:WXG100 family type VII secretion target n=1 Tax=Streptomyces flaveolus TaxID=67297 RepID=UPI0036F59464
MASQVEATDVEGMRRSAQVHAATAEKHRASYQSMVSLAQQAEAGWTGQAGANFKSALDGWLQNYKVVGAVLDEMHQRIIQNGGKVAETHQTTSDATQKTMAATSGPIGLRGF